MQNLRGVASNPFSRHLQNPEGVASNPLSPTHTHIITQFTSEGPRRLDISHRNVRNYKALKAVKKSLYHLQSKIKVSTPCEFMLMRLNLKKTLGVYQTCTLSPPPPLHLFTLSTRNTNSNGFSLWCISEYKGPVCSDALELGSSLPFAGR